MHDTASDPLASPAHNDAERRWNIHYEIAKHLHDNLPFTDSMSEAARARMLDAAISAVGDLRPANSMEAHYAASQVTHLFHATLCLAQAGLCPADAVLAGKLRAQAAQMGREARSYMTALLKLQEARAKRDSRRGAPEADAEDAPSIEESLRQAAAALAATPEPVPQPVLLARDTKQTAAPAPVRPAREPEPTEEEMEQRRLEQRADEYTVIYPLRARVIRRMRGMPEDAPFEAPDPVLMAEVLAANRCNQLWVDEMTSEEALIQGGQDRMGWPYEPDADPGVVRAALLNAGVDWQPGLPWNVPSAASVGR